VILGALVLLLLLAGWLVLWRVPLCRADPGDGPGSLTLSAVVPARNEEGAVGRLVRSLFGQDPPPDEVLVVDDDSGDATAGEAAAAGARVVSSRPLPEGWRGKTWACHQGALEAAGDLLLFVDADVWFEPGGLQRLTGTWSRTGGALSVVPFHRTRNAYESLSAFFNLAMVMGIGAFTFRGDRLGPAGLFGQMLLLRADDYRRSGGHRGVRGRILENLFLSRRLRSTGTALRCRGGRGTASMRMYPGGPGELAEGWSKAFVSGAGGVPPRLMVPIVAWMTGLVLCLPLTVLALAGHPAASPLWLAAYPLACVQVFLMLRRIGGFHPLAWLAYPVPLVFFFGLMTVSALKRARGVGVSWKGRQIGGGGGGDGG
jgi:4,4'-diaponeurosporenoate glycosyltransferase